MKPFTHSHSHRNCINVSQLLQLGCQCNYSNATTQKLVTISWFLPRKNELLHRLYTAEQSGIIRKYRRHMLYLSTCLEYAAFLCT